MYAHLTGNILMIDGIMITLQVKWTWLGLDILSAPTLLGNLKMWAEVSVWIHHHVTDISESLYGFESFEERSLFRELNKVNGVGGKTALALLGLGGENLMKAIHLEDDKLLSSVPGIGKKTAQKIIVDLKGSINFSKNAEKKWEKSTAPSTMNVISSLVQMGYDKLRVEEIIETLDTSLGIEDKVREAIKRLK